MSIDSVSGNATLETTTVEGARIANALNKITAGLAEAITRVAHATTGIDNTPLVVGAEIDTIACHIADGGYLQNSARHVSWAEAPDSAKNILRAGVRHLIDAGYSVITAASLQELQTQNRALRNKITELRGEIDYRDDLENEIASCMPEDFDGEDAQIAIIGEFVDQATTVYEHDPKNWRGILERFERSDLK